MLAITREGVRAIRELTKPKWADGLRIYADALSIKIEVAASPGVEDTVLEAEGARLYLPGDTLRALDDKVLDADLTGDEPHFAVLRQAAPERV